MAGVGVRRLSFVGYADMYGDRLYAFLDAAAIAGISIIFTLDGNIRRCCVRSRLPQFSSGCGAAEPQEAEASSWMTPGLCGCGRVDGG